MYIESDQRSLSDQDTSMPKGIPLTEHEQMRRRHEIFGLPFSFSAYRGARKPACDGLEPGCTLHQEKQPIFLDSYAHNRGQIGCTGTNSDRQ